MSENAPPVSHSSTAKIASALSKAQGAVGEVKKTREVTVDSAKGSYSYWYAELHAVIAAIRQPMLENGLAITFDLQENGKDMNAIATLWHESGESLRFSCPMPPFNSMQTLGSGKTYARRYILQDIFNIAGEDDDDGRLASAPTARNQPRQQQSQQQRPPAKPPEAKGKMATAAEITALIHECDAYGIGVDAQKKMLTEKIGRASWKDLTAVEYLRAKEGVDALCRAKDATIPGGSIPPEPDLNDVFPEDEPQVAPPDEPPRGKPNEQAPKKDLDDLWAHGLAKGLKERDITDLVVRRLGKQEWAKLTNFQAQAIRNAIDTWNPAKGGGR